MKTKARSSAKRSACSSPAGGWKSAIWSRRGRCPSTLRDNAGEWAGCVTGALPEKEYLDLMSQAGFSNVRTLRSTSAGKVEDVDVYSVIASASKPM